MTALISGADRCVGRSQPGNQCRRSGSAESSTMNAQKPGRPRAGICCMRVRQGGFISSCSKAWRPCWVLFSISEQRVRPGCRVSRFGSLGWFHQSHFRLAIIMRYLIPTMPMMFCGIDLRLHAGSLRAGHPFWIFSRHLPTLCRTSASQGADGFYGVSSTRVTNGLVHGIAEVLVPLCGSRCNLFCGMLRH